MTIARTSTDMLAVATDPVDPVTWTIKAITVTTAAIVVCFERNLAMFAARGPSAGRSTT